MSRILAWFSCGAASAVAAYYALQMYSKKTVSVVYCDTMVNEHPDNQRFFTDVQEWLGVEIQIIHSDLYRSIDDVAERTGYMAGVQGARCTTELKKIPRRCFENPDDTHVFGYTAEEAKRIADFENNNPELKVEWVLRDMGIKKADCLKTLQMAGIELPVMYSLGYNNNNCLGCFKATSKKYWNKIRRDFPEVFLKRCEQSRKLGVRLTRHNGERIFLDELPMDATDDPGFVEDLSCGVACQSGALP